MSEDVKITLMAVISDALAELDKVGHKLYGGCFVVKCEENHFVSSCSCDGGVKRLHFVTHVRWCDRPEIVSI